MARGWRTGVATLTVAVLALCAFAGVTHGFAAVTSDGVRRAALAGTPRALPPIGLVDAAGRAFSLADYGQPSQPATFVALVYVRCQTICLTTAAGQSWLQGEIQARGLGDRVRLLTLSFDPASDTPAVLADHARRLGADPALWRFATVRDGADLKPMLDLFDVVVLPDGLGGYAHNGALFLVGEDGRLSRAYDIDRPDVALADYLRRAGLL
ncbi:SCO family protein [Ramlibacter tataouinensis]|uniref:SCO family protein n=1 Tax=Ramlibacter tataouinensis TaxID=94132 RepID=UPI0022F39802|nr:SCO family protein [Ramlibacter tataouinensis]WBY02661.1 SCO family protein [Ramlibacter tataouinensis]